MKNAFARICRKAQSSKLAITTAVMTVGASSGFSQGFDPVTAATDATTSAVSIAGLVATAGVTIVLGFLAVKLIRKA